MAEAEYQVCDQFTVLATRPNPAISRCDVCDQGENVHASPGRRVASGGEIEALRRQMLIAIHERQQGERPAHSHNGSGHARNVTPPESKE